MLDVINFDEPFIDQLPNIKRVFILLSHELALSLRNFTQPRTSLYMQDQEIMFAVHCLVG